MKILEASIMNRGFKGFEATLSSEANTLLGEALLWRGHSVESAIAKVQAYFNEKGHNVLVQAASEITDCSENAQQAAYTAYKAKGGDMPLSIFLEG